MEQLNNVQLTDKAPFTTSAFVNKWIEEDRLRHSISITASLLSLRCDVTVSDAAGECEYVGGGGGNGGT